MRVLYFAWLRERLGIAEEAIAVPAGVATVGDLLAWQRARGPVHAAAFADSGRIRCAVNQEFANLTNPVGAQDEVAFFPPVTGG